MRECRNMRLALRGRCAAAAATLVSAFLCVVQPTKADPLHALRFEGICNASAGVALAENLFVVADDEDKVVSRKLAYKPLPFRVYSLSRPGKPISIGVLPGEDIDPVVADNVSGELDLEASAPLGGIVFWIGSHSSGSGGSQAPNRRRLFAVQFNMQGEQLNVKRVGHAYGTLLEDLAKDHRYDQFKLQDAAKIDSKTTAGLSIEGMTALPDGTLAIGFRNPVPSGQALVATLLNPIQVTEGQQARFGEPIERVHIL